MANPKIDLVKVMLAAGEVMVESAKTPEDLAGYLFALGMKLLDGQDTNGLLGWCSEYAEGLWALNK